MVAKVKKSKSGPGSISKNSETGQLYRTFNGEALVKTKYVCYKVDKDFNMIDETPVLISGDKLVLVGYVD